MVETDKAVELRSNQRSRPRPFLRENGEIDYLDRFNLEKMRALGYELTPTFDPLKKIKSVETIQNSDVACEICEDSVKNEKTVANYRVWYEDGDNRMFCRNHKPLFVKGDTSWQDRADVK